MLCKSYQQVTSCIIYYVKKKLIKFQNSLEEEVWKMLKAQGYTSEAIVQSPMSVSQLL